MSSPADVCIVIPCYNESRRLQSQSFTDYLSSTESARILFVDDGSTDNTAALLDTICQASLGRAALVRRPRNAGKAEAVRVGLLKALRDNQARFVGFWDADLATPLDAILRFARILEESPAIDMVFGSRVQLLGRHVERSAIRHYLGRVFATAASIVLEMPIYDTQCGAKLFRSSPQLRSALARPFLSKWVFDVELIARLHNLYLASAAILEHAIFEYPLESWRDVAGSKVHPVDFLRAFVDLIRIRFRYRPIPAK